MFTSSVRFGFRKETIISIYFILNTFFFLPNKEGEYSKENCVLKFGVAVIIIIEIFYYYYYCY